MANKWGLGAVWVVDKGAHPHEANYLKLDISKARNRVNWRPVLNLGEALELIIEWAQKVGAGVDARGLTLRQINDYQNRVSRR
jgi:CDP-glucose 4,6-dehydratase